ncbi:protein of unknown function [Ruminococcaceae bacterium BL-6]|nr:protein of unknown function [Ruminococcaceae bacterium BL-6]
MTRKEVRKWCFFGLMEVLWLLFLHLEKIAQLFPRYMAGISPRFFYVAAVLCLMGGIPPFAFAWAETGFSHLRFLEDEKMRRPYITFLILMAILIFSFTAYSYAD